MSPPFFQGKFPLAEEMATIHPKDYERKVTLHSTPAFFRKRAGLSRISHR
jgi:hypothetical protein